jgi:hypothetical protein
MNQYTDLQIVECNRLHSEEAKSKNNENFSLWTNNLTDIVHLEPGDKVSVHAAMISERGAGQATSIEIKGESLGFKKVFEYTDIQKSDAIPIIPSGFAKISASMNSSEIEMRDDTGVFTISYYLNRNGHNSISLPRRWWWVPASKKRNFTDNDDRSKYGMSVWDACSNSSTFCGTLYDDIYQISAFPGFGEGDENESGNLTKIKNDNSRFTIMIRDITYYSKAAANGNLPTNNLREPENAIYMTYKELKKVKIEKGFNSPEFIAQEITRQLQEVKSQETFKKRSPADEAVNYFRPGYPVPMYSSFNTETYKSFDCAGIYSPIGDGTSNLQRNWFNYYNDDYAASNASGYEYLNQYHIVACKRPELYETGRLLNSVIEGDNPYYDEYKGIEGGQVAYNYDGTEVQGTKGIILTTFYTKENVEKWRNFILAQEKYPEVWNVFSDYRTNYSDLDTIDNSRWCHINRYWNGSMQIVAGVSDVALGWSGWNYPHWHTITAETTLASLILPFQYDSSQKDIFYESPNESLQQKSYGCFGKTKNNRIVIYPTANNGSGSTLFNYLNYNPTNQFIEEARKIGYDMHFSAPGNAWILPYSGISQHPNSYDDRAPKMNSYEMAPNSQPAIIDAYKIQTNELRNKLYLGADAPKLNWDGTNFSLSDLHTAMNRGNNQGAGANWVNAKFDADPDASDVVFKINPEEHFGDYTPDRMPYQEKIAYDVNASDTYYTPVVNSNLEPWTIYDARTGINIEDFNLNEDEWEGSFWDLLGFSYRQFHSSTNNRLKRIDNTNVNDLSVITTNALIPEGATKFYSQNMFGTPLYNIMLPRTGGFKNQYSNTFNIAAYYPPIVQDCSSIKIVAARLPTRMIRGYYTIRSNLLTDAPFVGGKVNNTTMPVIGIVDKRNADGDFYFGEESSLQFTITKPIRLASLSCSIHDPDGSYANTSEQNSVLFKIQKNRNVSFNVVEEILQENKGKWPANL